MTDKDQVTYSVLVPVFCEAESLVELTDRIAATFAKIGAAGGFEVLFVDDGSTDATPEVLADLRHRRAYVRSITLRRNCGKSMALMAGFQNCRGRYVITMDGDLQDNPEDIPVLLEKLGQGNDVVSGLRRKRQDQLVRKAGSRLFNWAVRRTTGLGIHDFNCGFKLYRREAVDDLCVFGQYHRYIPLQAHLIGYRVAEAEVTNSARKHGTSKYGAIRYQGLFDLLSILFTYKYGLKPLHFFGKISLFFIGPSLVTLCYLVGEHALYLLGLGSEFALLNRPLLSLSLTVLAIGVFVFLTGFVCDFILHHQIRQNIGRIVDLNVADISARDGGSDSGEPGFDPDIEEPPRLSNVN